MRNTGSWYTLLRRLNNNNLTFTLSALTLLVSVRIIGYRERVDNNCKGAGGKPQTY